MEVKEIIKKKKKSDNIMLLGAVGAAISAFILVTIFFHFYGKKSDNLLNSFSEFIIKNPNIGWTLLGIFIIGVVWLIVDKIVKSVKYGKKSDKWKETITTGDIATIYVPSRYIDGVITKINADGTCELNVKINITSIEIPLNEI